MRSLLRCAGKIQRRPRPAKVEGLTAHCMRGIKISLNDDKFAEDLAGAWKKGKLKKDRDFLLFYTPFPPWLEVASSSI